MCLLIVLWQGRDDLPVVVGANRDERLNRPAIPMTVLRSGAPRVLGGRDEEAGGTWFALNEQGVFAGLTNRPPGDGGREAGREAGPEGIGRPGKRSRGELPLALASARSAGESVAAFAAAYRPEDYNPAWMLVGDRDGLFAVDMTGTGVPAVTPLAPGLHIVENHPPGTETPKVARVRRLLAGIERLPADDLVPRLETVLADHHQPATGERAAVSAACVHAEGYGTRWSGIVTVTRAAGSRPRFRYSDGSPCRAPFVEADWDDDGRPG